MKLLTTWAVLIAFQFAASAQAATFYFHTDHLGTPQVLTDENQAVVWQGDYDSFGQATETIATLEQNLRFPGQYLDRESGPHYNYFRTYDPSTGRYTQSDPIGLRGGINTYAYVGGNPLMYVDLLGLFQVCRRPLSFTGGYMSSGVTGTNFGIFHEHGFYEDGTGDNTGFTTDGLFDDRKNANQYQCNNESYDDDTMRQAQSNIADNWQSDYSLFNNCQNYIDALIDEYDNIQNPPKCRMTRRGLRCK